MEERIELEELPHPQIDLNLVANMSNLEIEKYADKRGYKLQFIAAEKGHIIAINALINRCVDFDCEVEGKTPADLAFENKHYEVVLNLLNANFHFPHNFDAKIVPSELKNFANLSSEVHDTIVNDKLEKLKEILSKNTDLRYFYDVTNKSAIRAAIEHKRFRIYEVLLSNKIYPSPHDDMSFIVRRNLNSAERLQLKEINETLSSSVLAEPMATLMQNSFFGPDCPDRELYQNFIHKAYSHLLQIKRIAKIIDVVVASRVFKIVYDFKRETVSYVDPLSEPYTNGIFYFSGKIFIGAIGLLDPSQYFQVLGVIAHELGHYAMLLTYENMANPYYKKDEAGMRKFEGIVQDCKAEMESEELISLVFDEYPKSSHHAETIVRVPHMVAQYHENQETIVEKIQTYPSLFKNYDEDVMPDMDKAIPRIKKKFRTEGEKKLEKQRRLIAFISVLFTVFLLASIPLGIWLKGTNYSWQTLSDVQKAKVNDAIITYYGVDVKFGELFSNNSNIQKNLNHMQIKGALDGDPKDLNMAINTTLHNLINLQWENLPIKLKDKVLSTNVSFQGSSIPMNKFLSNKSLAPPFLTSLNLVNILNSSGFEIASKIENNWNFYQERKFELESCGARKKIPCVVKKSNEIINNTSESKKFVLSSKAGEGKSTSMKHFALVLKSKYPWMWIQEVDLKKNLDAFRIGEKLNLGVKKELVNFLADHLINSTEFNREVFSELFEKNRVVFLWDGADEIFPQFESFMMKLVKSIADLSENWQFISTREEYSQDLSNCLDIEAYKLVPFDENERFEFLMKYIATSLFELDAEVFYQNFKSFQNLTEFSSDLKSYLATFNETMREKVTIAVIRGTKTLKSIEVSSQYGEFVTNPLLIRMIAETASYEGSDKAKGIYAIYDNFVNKKYVMAQMRGEVVQANINKIANSAQATYKQILQLHALKLIFKRQVEHMNSNFFDEKIKKATSNINLDQISRYGILTMNSDGDFEFVHRTFAEFFVAQYFISNIDDLKETNDDYTKDKLYMLNSFLYTDYFRGVKNFFNDYFDENSEESFVLNTNRNLRDKSLKNEGMSRDVFNFLNFANASFHFAKTHKIEQNLIVLNIDWFFRGISGFNENLVNDWILIEKNFDLELIKFSMKFKDEHGYNFIFKLFGFLLYYDSEGAFESFILIFKSTFNRSELQDMYFNNKRNVFMVAAEIQDKGNLKILWNFTTDIFNEKEQKNILLMENQKKFNALELSGTNYRGNVFKFVQKLYEAHFKPQEIKNMIESFDERYGAFYFTQWKSDKVKHCQVLSKFMFNLYNDELKRLSRFLTHRFQYLTLFTLLSSKECTKVFTDLLRKTYGKDEEDLFMSDFEDLDSTLDIKFKKLKREDFFIKNILHNLAVLIKEKPLRELWDFLKSTLNETDMKTILQQEDHDGYNLLDFFARNKHRKSFEFIQSVFGENFSTEEIKKIVLKVNERKFPFFFSSIYYGNVETSEAISEFLLKMFENDKLALRKLIRYSEESTIFYKGMVFDESVKVFIRLLRKTYRDDEEELFQSDFKESSGVFFQSNKLI